MSYTEGDTVADKYVSGFNTNYPIHTQDQPVLLPLSLSLVASTSCSTTSPPIQTRRASSGSTQTPPSPSLSARFSSASCSIVRQNSNSPPTTPGLQAASSSSNSTFPPLSPSLASTAHILQLQAHILQLQAQFLLNPELQQPGSPTLVPISVNGSGVSPQSQPQSPKSQQHFQQQHVQPHSPSLQYHSSPSLQSRPDPRIIPHRASFDRGRLSISNAEVDAILKSVTSPLNNRTPSTNVQYQKRKSQLTPADESVHGKSPITYPRRTSSHIVQQPQPQQQQQQDDRSHSSRRRSQKHPSDDYQKRTSLFTPLEDPNAPLHLSSPRKRSSLRVFPDHRPIGGPFQFFIPLTSAFWHVVSVLKFRIELEASAALELSAGSQDMGVTVYANTQANCDHGVRLVHSIIRDDRTGPPSSPRLMGKQNSSSKPMPMKTPRQDSTQKQEGSVRDRTESISSLAAEVSDIVAARRGSTPYIESPLQRSHTSESSPLQRIPTSEPALQRIQTSEPSPLVLSPIRDSRNESISHLAAEVRNLLELSSSRKSNAEAEKNAPPSPTELKRNASRSVSPPRPVEDAKKTPTEDSFEADRKQDATVEAQPSKPDSDTPPSPTIRYGSSPTAAKGQWVKKSQVPRRTSVRKDMQKSLTHRPDTAPPSGRGSLIGKLTMGWNSEGTLRAMEKRHSRFGHVLPPELKAADPSQQITHAFGTIMSGVLSKRGKGRIRSWQRRFFMLTRSRLWYYKGNKSLKLAMDITGDTVLQMLPGQAEFLVAGLNKESTYHLMAPSDELRMEWLEAINGLIEDDKASQHFDTRFGEIELRLWFNEDSATLNAVILKGRRISVNVPMFGKRPANSFVTLVVTDDKKSHKTVKTGTVKASTEPVWKEPFLFLLNDSVLTLQTLSIRVMSDEKGKSVLIGMLDIPLINVPFEEKEATNTWYTLQPEKKPIVTLGGSPLLPEPPLSRTGSKSSYSASLSTPVGFQPSGSRSHNTPTLTRSGSASTSSFSGSFSFSGESPSTSSTHIRGDSTNGSVFRHSSHILDSSTSSLVKCSPSMSNGDLPSRFPGPPPTTLPRTPELETGSLARRSYRMSSSDVGMPKIMIQKPDDIEVKQLPGPPEEPRPQLGFVRLSIWYDSSREILFVDIRECYGLPPALLPRDPFVELKLLPADANASNPILKTKVQRKTLEPLFDERFEFSIEQQKVGFKLLALSVMDRGGTFGKDKIIGEVIIPLDSIPRTTFGATQERMITAVSSTVFEINQLGDLLLLEPGFQSFLSMLTREHSRENLLFWKAVQDFRYKYLDANIDLRAACLSEAIDIVAQFIQSGSDYEINVPSTIKNQIQSALAEEKIRNKFLCETLASIFDFAQAEVLDLMSRDTFSRYLVSKEWGAFCDYLAQERTEKELGYRVVNMISAYSQTLKSRNTRSGSITEGRPSSSSPGFRGPRSSTIKTGHARPWSTTTDRFRKKSLPKTDSFTTGGSVDGEFS